LLGKEVWTIQFLALDFNVVRLFRWTDHMHKRTFLSIGTWIAIILTMWVIAWLIGESIPVFNDLLGLISALFASWNDFEQSFVQFKC
jgi:hypothetical protein